jgi:hypothetical protein
MKKLVLGLLLTAGICGNAWASEGKVLNMKKNFEINKNVKAAILKNAKSSGPFLLFDCIIATTVTIVDNAGGELSSNTYYTAGKGDECNGSNGAIKSVGVTVPISGVSMPAHP